MPALPQQMLLLRGLEQLEPRDRPQHRARLATRSLRVPEVARVLEGDAQLGAGGARPRGAAAMSSETSTTFAMP